MPVRVPILRIFKVRESGNAEFWVSNLVVMASTIIGVYLAAQAGFATALQFEVARSERDGYYMRRALIDEVKDNLAAVDESVRAFVLDGEMENFIRSAASGFEVIATVNGEKRSLTFNAVADGAPDQARQLMRAHIESWNRR